MVIGMLSSVGMLASRDRERCFMSDEVWESGAESTGGSDEFGTPDYDEGLPVNAAFSIDSVFKYGLGFLQEAPAVALLGGLNMLLAAFLPSLINMPISVAITVMGETGELDPTAAQVLSNLSGIVIGLMFWPINQLIIAGIIVGAVVWIRNDEASIGALYTSFGAAVRAFLASLVAGVVSMTAAIVAMTPAGIALGVGISMENITVALGVGGLLMVPAMFVMIYVGLGVLLTPYAAVLDNLGPMEALSRSWQAADGARVTLFVTNFVFGILGVVASCMCMVPLILVVPIQQGGFVAAWLRYARHTDETSGLAFFERHV